MLLRPARIVAVLLTTTALTAAVPAVTSVPAAALGSCDFPLPLTFDWVGTGAFVGPNDADYWSYSAFGRTNVFVVSTSSATYAEVYTASCGTAVPCESTAEVVGCTVTYEGPLVVVVRGGGAYTVVVSGEGDPPPGYYCEPIDTGGGCVDVNPGTALVDETMYELVAPVSATHTVAGWVDAYRFSGPTGGSTTVACVVLAMNATTADACAVAGGTRLGRVANLVAQPVDERTVQQGAMLGRVRVCQATTTVTVLGLGVEEFPGYSLC